jgi:hypothetical protein
MKTIYPISAGIVEGHFYAVNTFPNLPSTDHHEYVVHVERSQMMVVCGVENAEK